MKNKSIYALLIGLLFFSIGINIVFYNRILILQDFIKGYNPWVSVEQLNSMEKEIEKLSTKKYTNSINNNLQYDVKTRQPIVNDWLQKK